MLNIIYNIFNIYYLYQKHLLKYEKKKINYQQLH